MNKWIKTHFALSDETKSEIKDGLLEVLWILLLPLFFVGLLIFFLLWGLWINLLQIILPFIFVFYGIYTIYDHRKDIKEWFNDTIVDNIRKGLNVLMHPKECILKPLYELFKC